MEAWKDGQQGLREGSTRQVPWILRKPPRILITRLATSQSAVAQAQDGRRTLRGAFD